jgi:zinc resistance-associated protein
MRAVGRCRVIAAATEREMEHAMSGRLRAALLVTGALGLGLVGAAAAHDRGSDGFRGHGRWSALTPEDRAAFADARIAGLHAGLKLNADQEKLWPPVEAALRDMVKLRQQRREAMPDRPKMSDDAPAALRAMADAASARGEALRKLADAAQPLYASLDEGQKRRAMILARPMGGHRHGGWHRHRDDERGPGGDDR